MWWSAVAIALCAAAGSLLWGAFVLTPKTQGESWTAWAFKGAVGVLLASYLIEPLIRHLQTGRRSNFHPRFRSAKLAFQGVLDRYHRLRCSRTPTAMAFSSRSIPSGNGAPQASYWA